MAHFPWMGGPHDCDGAEDTARCAVTFVEPEPEGRFISDVLMEITIGGWELAHLERFMERVRDDDEVNSIEVLVRTGGTLEFFGGLCMYSAEIGRYSSGWDDED
ncbi:hypothetical protein [Mycolicibacterium confluentis]|uniref:Uncharacterized protein n=1 Tax=Mycolicibacterium confluentis TaxID=28047 RepID=A0A7I7XUR8_9MYCO|nr:hypothetical protein [Mycolicibacterium confluentis]MCV7322300.1 hypothetical protein [Mycolicibacterium confluentis]ORV28380.1 hypothetical protein AWB99_17745 [Mycolicibacterium confluentis]BBZ33016.1 hypothetical protein MCNF_16210 [Mycolicibacterium confluentis]